MTIAVAVDYTLGGVQTGCLTIEAHSIAANVDTDELHQFKLSTGLAAAKESLKKEDFRPGYAEGITHLALNTPALRARASPGVAPHPSTPSSAQPGNVAGRATIRLVG